MGPLVDLQNLSDYRVARDEPDPRGWDVISCDSVTVGKVVSLLVDLEQSKARYFVTEAGSRRITLPTAFARLDSHHKRVIYDTASAAVIEALPAFAGELSKADVEAIDAAITGTRIQPAVGGESVDRRAERRREHE